MNNHQRRKAIRACKRDGHRAKYSEAKSCSVCIVCKVWIKAAKAGTE